MDRGLANLIANSCRFTSPFDLRVLKEYKSLADFRGKLTRPFIPSNLST